MPVLAVVLARLLRLDESLGIGLLLLGASGGAPVLPKLAQMARGNLAFAVGLGAPARAIQELAGHQDLTTTQRYMHLSPAARDGAIRLLDASGVPRSFGDILETADR